VQSSELWLEGFSENMALDKQEKATMTMLEQAELLGRDRSGL